MSITRGLSAVAIFSALGLALAVESASPAKALAPPPDGNYTYSEAGTPASTWRMATLCDQVNGSRYYEDYSNPLIQANFCSVTVVSTTANNISRAEGLQNYSSKARLAGQLWTFQVNQDAGVQCPDGSTAPSTETYAFDDATLTGTHTSLHGEVCGMQPAMSKQPFNLQFVGPLSPPVERYPLYCNNIAMCY
jgi:hypothetical protein